MYARLTDVLVSEPDSFYTFFTKAVIACLPLAGVSINVLQQVADPYGDGDDIQDWRMEERDTTGQRSSGFRSGTRLVSQEGGKIEETLQLAEDQVVGMLTRAFPASVRLVLHWLVLESKRVQICCYRVQMPGEEAKDFTPDELATLDALAPHLALILRLGTAYKVRASGYEFFSRRTIDLAQRFGLTSAEYRVLHKLVTGASNTEIAGDMGTSVATVKTHITHIMQKTGCRNRNALFGRYYSSPESISL